MVPVRRSPFFSQTVSASAGSAQLVASAHTTLRNNFIETDFTASIKTAHYPAASPAVHPAADRRALFRSLASTVPHHSPQSPRAPPSPVRRPCPSPSSSGGALRPPG